MYVALALAADLFDHVQGIKFVIMLFVKPRAFEFKQPQSGQARHGQSVPCQLFNGLFFVGIWLVVQQMDLAVSDLDEIDVAGK